MQILTLRDPGAVRLDGSKALTADWDVGDFSLTAENLTLDGTFTDGTAQIQGGVGSGFIGISIGDTSYGSSMINRIDAGDFEVKASTGDLILTSGIADIRMNGSSVILDTTMTLSSGSIVDSGGTIDFSSNILITTGQINALDFNIATGGALEIDDVDVLWIEGTSNIHFGSGAGAGNTGARNLFLGVDAGGDSCTGSDNVFLGPGAGFDITSGTGNMLIGRGSGANLTATSNNTAIGSFTLATMTGVGPLQNNVAIGYYSLRYAQGANRCTAIGTYSLYNTSQGAGTATENVGIGYKVLYTLSGGDYNVAVGSYALYKVKTTFWNTAVGHKAGYTTNDSGGNYFGYYAGYYNTRANRLYIDNQNRGSTANDDIYAILYGIMNASGVDDPALQLLTVNASLRVSADYGSGLAATLTLTGTTDTPTTDPGWASSSSVDMNVPDGYIKAYVGTQAVVMPYWNT